MRLFLESNLFLVNFIFHYFWNVLFFYCNFLIKNQIKAPSTGKSEAHFGQFWHIWFPGKSSKDYDQTLTCEFIQGRQSFTSVPVLVVIVAQEDQKGIERGVFCLFDFSPPPFCTRKYFKKFIPPSYLTKRPRHLKFGVDLTDPAKLVFQLIAWLDKVCIDRIIQQKQKQKKQKKQYFEIIE